MDIITEKLFKRMVLPLFAASFDQLLACGSKKTQKICCPRSVLRVNVGVKRS